VSERFPRHTAGKPETRATTRERGPPQGLAVAPVSRNAFVANRSAHPHAFTTATRLGFHAVAFMAERYQSDDAWFLCNTYYNDPA